MTEASNPLTEQQHRLFGEELAGAKANLNEFRVALVNRYGEHFDGALFLQRAIESLGEVERAMTRQAEQDLPDFEGALYGDAACEEREAD